MTEIGNKIGKKAVDLTLGVRGLLASPEPIPTSVKDLREVVTYKDGRKCRYPSNYHEIVESGEIIFDEETKKYRLFYDGKNFDLALVTKAGDRSYFTIDFLVDSKNREVKRYGGYYKPFSFSKINLKEHLPVFEAQEIKNPKDPLLPSSYKLTNSSILDEKGRNGQLLYTSHYQNLNISFFEIRDRNGNLEFDKSIVSVPIVVVSVVVNGSVKLLVYLPEKLGEYLRGKQNLAAKFFGNCLLVPIKVAKNTTELVTTLTKTVPALLLTGGEKEEYGDKYVTISLAQFKECLGGIKDDWNTIFVGGNSEVGEKEKSPNFQITATWKELNAMKAKIEEDLEKQKNSNSKGADETLSHSKNLSFETLRSESNNIGGEVVKKLQERRNSQTENGTRSV